MEGSNTAAKRVKCCQKKGKRKKFIEFIAQQPAKQTSRFGFDRYRRILFVTNYDSKRKCILHVNINESVEGRWAINENGKKCTKINQT